MGVDISVRPIRAVAIFEGKIYFITRLSPLRMPVQQQSDPPSPTQLSLSRMGKIEAEICSVCKENASKYRCPGCGAPYCSLACNKVHKAGGGVGSPRPPCTGKRAVPGSKQAGGQSSSGQSARKRPHGGGDDADATEPATRACVRKGRDQWRGGREDREEEEWQMSADQRDRILGCSWLKVALRDPKLQGLLVSLVLCTFVLFDDYGSIAQHVRAVPWGCLRI